MTDLPAIYYFVGFFFGTLFVLGIAEQLYYYLKGREKRIEPQ